MIEIFDNFDGKKEMIKIINIFQIYYFINFFIIKLIRIYNDTFYINCIYAQVPLHTHPFFILKIFCNYLIIKRLYLIRSGVGLTTFINILKFSFLKNF